MVSLRFLAAGLALATSCNAQNSTGNLTVAQALEQILEDIETATGCDDCNAMLKTIQEIAMQGDDAYAELATEFCIAIDEAPDDECEGLMALEAPSMAFSLRNMEIPSRTSDLWCANVYSLCSVPSVEPYTVPVPAPGKEVSRPAPSGREPIKVVHISDIHVDLAYEVGASTNCTQDICCFTYEADDAPGVTDYPAGPWGEHTCDSPLDLSLSMYSAIMDFVPDAAFTVFTGDLVEGREWSTTHAEIVQDINSAYQHMAAAGLGAQVYGTVGNHEASPVNSFPQAAIAGAIACNQSNQYMYNALASNWAQWIGPTSAATARTHGGAYSVVHEQNLRVISINTMFYMAENWWLYTPSMQPDPNDQFAWLVDELQAAEDADQRVWIIGHIPFGRPDALYDYSEYFDQIVQRYAATIAAHFWGHTHKDMWEVSYRNYSAPSADSAVAVHYIAPALTPTSGNPPFRVYSVDPETWAVLDYTVYVANMSAPNYQAAGPVWEEYYSVKAAYGALLDPPYTDPAAELTPAFWHNVSVLFEGNDTVFQEYYARKTRGWDVSTCGDDDSCKADEICQMRSSQSQYACLDGASVSLRRRDADSSNAHEEHGCPGSRAKRVVGRFSEDVGLLRRLAGKVKARRV